MYARGRESRDIPVPKGAPPGGGKYTRAYQWFLVTCTGMLIQVCHRICTKCHSTSPNSFPDDCQSASPPAQHADAGSLPYPYKKVQASSPRVSLPLLS